MSSLYSRDPRNMQSNDTRWGNETFTEDVLAESGRRTRTLSEARRYAVLQVLLAEAARLKELSMRAARRNPAVRALLRWLTPRMALTMAACIALIGGGVAYALFGGDQISANAQLNGVAALSERRFGPLGLQWNIAKQPEAMSAFALHLGDTIVAVTPITITYADGSQLVAAAGSHLSVLANNAGVSLVDGELVSQITPSNTGATKFRVETNAGTIAVKGTEFRVRADAEGITHFTDKGLVSVSNDVAAVDVGTGEQVRVYTGQPLVAELQVPRVTFETRATGRVVSNKAQIPFETRIYPSGTFVVVDAKSGSILGRFIADAEGVIKAALPNIEKMADVQFRQEAADGRVSAASNVVNVVIDHEPPALAITRVQRDSAQVQVVGRTELGAEVRVNGALVPLSSDGTFVADLKLAETKTVEITVIDLAGNVTTMTQALQ